MGKRTIDYSMFGTPKEKTEKGIEKPELDYSMFGTPAEDDSAVEAELQSLREGEPAKFVAGGAGFGLLPAAMESPAGPGIAAVGEAIDKYTGAPTRAAYGAALDLENPLAAFAEQFGEDTSKAPTGLDLAKMSGLTGKAATVAGFAFDMGLDPINVIPVAKLAKLGAKGIVKGGPFIAKHALKGSAMATDAATGTKLTSTTVDTALGVTKDASDAVNRFVNPKQALDMNEMFAIAEKNRIDPHTLPEAVEFGKGSIVSRGQRRQTEGMLAEKYKKQHENATISVNKAIDDRVKSYSTVLDEKGEVLKQGKTIGKREAGQAIRDGLDEATTQVFEDANITYNTVTKMAPKVRLTDDAAHILDVGSDKKGVIGLRKIKKEANRRVRSTGMSEMSKRQAQEVSNAVDRIREAKGSYPLLVEQLKSLGDEAFKNKHIHGTPDPPDIKSLRKIYFSLSESLKGTADSVVPGISKEIEKSNKLLTNFFGDKSFLARAGNSKMANENLFKSLVENGNTLEVQALKNILPPEKFNQMKGAFMDSIMARNSDDLISFKKLSNTMNRKKETMKILFTPQEIVDMRELVKLGDRLDLPNLTSSGPREILDIGFNKLGDAVYNQTMLDFLKKRARAAGISEKTTNKILKKGTVGISEILRKTAKLKGPRELIIPKALKIAKEPPIYNVATGEREQ